MENLSSELARDLCREKGGDHFDKFAAAPARHVRSSESCLA